MRCVRLLLAGLAGLCMAGAAVASTPPSESGLRDISWMEGSWHATSQGPYGMPERIESTFTFNSDATSLNTTLEVTRVWQVIVQQRESFQWDAKSCELVRLIDRDGRVEKVQVVLERDEHAFRLMDRVPPKKPDVAGIEFIRESDDKFIARVLVGPERMRGNPVIYRRLIPSKTGLGR